MYRQRLLTTTEAAAKLTWSISVMVAMRRPSACIVVWIGWLCEWLVGLYELRPAELVSVVMMVEARKTGFARLVEGKMIVGRTKRGSSGKGQIYLISELDCCQGRTGQRQYCLQALQQRMQ